MPSFRDCEAITLIFYERKSSAFSIETVYVLNHYTMLLDEVNIYATAFFFSYINVISLNLVEVFFLSMICPTLARAIHSIGLMASGKISQTIWFIQFQICQNPSLAPRPSSKIAAPCILLSYFSQP